MMGYVAEVVAVVFAAFVAGSAVGWLLYRLLDRTRAGYAQQVVTDVIGRGLGLSPAVNAEARLARREAREQRAEERILAREERSAARASARQRPAAAAARAEIREERQAPRGIPISPSEALAAAKTAGGRALIPAVTVPRAERDSVKVRAAKIGNVWTVDEDADDDRDAWAESGPGRRTALASGQSRARARVDADPDDAWATPSALTWPIGSGAKLLPSPQRVANGANRLLLRLEAKRPGPILLAGPGPVASDAIWSDEPTRTAPKLTARARLADTRPAAAAGKPSAANGKMVAALRNGAALGSSRFGRTLADAADRAWDKAGSDAPAPSAPRRRAAARDVPSLPVVASAPLLTRAAKPSVPALTSAARPADVDVRGDGAPFLFPSPPARRDNLRRVRGIGHSFEHRLHDLGVYQLVQIANWSAKEQAWVSAALAAPGKVEREDWVGQAQALLAVRKASGTSVDAEVFRDP